MQHIIDWAKSYLDDVKNKRIHFNSPFDSGTITFEEEGIRVKFSNDGLIKMDVFVTSSKTNEYVKMGEFIWNVDAFSPEDKKYYGKNDYAVRMMKMLEVTDSTFYKIGIKYMSLMIFAAYYRPEFEAKKKVIVEQKNRKSKKKSKRNNRTLYNRQYVINSENVSMLPKPKRNIKKCDHEYSVRGHYRHCKSGKVVWVSAYRKNVGKNKETDRNYVAKMKKQEEK